MDDFGEFTSFTGSVSDNTTTEATKGELSVPV